MCKTNKTEDCLNCDHMEERDAANQGKPVFIYEINREESRQQIICWVCEIT